MCSCQGNCEVTTLEPPDPYDFWIYLILIVGVLSLICVLLYTAPVHASGFVN